MSTLIDYAPNAQGLGSRWKVAQAYVDDGEHAVVPKMSTRWDVRIVDREGRTTGQLQLWRGENGWLVSTAEECAAKG